MIVRRTIAAAHGQQIDEENTRLLNNAKAKFQEFTVKVNEEIYNASNMILEAKKSAQKEYMIIELRRIDDFLVSIREECTEYIKHVNILFSLFLNGNISEAEQIATQTEKLEENSNQRLEGFMFETEKITRNNLLSIGEREGKAIIVVAMILGVALLNMILAIFLNYNYKDHDS